MSAAVRLLGVVGAISIATMSLLAACGSDHSVPSRDARPERPAGRESCVSEKGCASSKAGHFAACLPEVIKEPTLTMDEAIREVESLHGTLVRIRAPLYVEPLCTAARCAGDCCNECSGRATLGSYFEQGRYFPLMGIVCKGDDSGLCCPFGIVGSPWRAMGRAAGPVAPEVIASGRLIDIRRMPDSFRDEFGRHFLSAPAALVGSSDGSPTICIPPAAK